MSRLRFVTSFFSLNLTQFFTAFNDNLFKLLLVFFLISLLGEEHSNTILALAGAIFVIPFLLFASLAGTLADRFSKRSVIYFTRLLEILTTSLGILAFYFHSPFWSYSILFLMATHSALFSPSKYGIIPEIVTKERVPHCNGILTATTYFAIILGTFFASFLTEVTNKNFVLAVSFCVVVAVIGGVSSLGIEKTFPQAAKKKVSVRFITEIFRTLKKAKKTRYLLVTIVFGAYFLFMGAYTQLNIIPFTLQSLHMSEVHGGYLFLLTAIGIGIGSFLTGKLSGKDVELGFVPLAAFGVTLGFSGLYLFEDNFWAVVFLLIFLGMCGGFYVVPTEIFIQLASLDEDRGANLASSSFLSFIGVIIASFLIAFLGNVLELKASEGFLIVGILTFFMAVGLFIFYADQVLRLFAATLAKLFWHIRVAGKGRARMSPPVLMVAPRTSWVDTMIVMATLPRMIRYIVPTPEKKRHSFFYRMLRFIPVDMEHFAPMGAPAIEAVKKELSTGHSVCLMHPIDFPAQTLKEWEEKLKALLKDIGVPVMPVHISKRVLKRKIKKLSVKVYFGQTPE